jgi:hypothetical protein
LGSHAGQGRWQKLFELTRRGRAAPQLALDVTSRHIRHENRME